MKVLATSKKYFRVFFTLLKISLQVDLEYRVDFFVNVLTQIISISTFLILIDVIFNQVDQIAGWSKYEIIFIYGIFRLIKPILTSFIFLNLKNISNVIVEGQLDNFISKPINTLFLLSFNKIDFFPLSESIIGFIIVIYSIPHIVLVIIPVSIIAFFYSVLLFTIIFYTILLCFFTLSFWLGPINHGYWVYDALSGVSIFPINAFKGIWNVIFVILIPFVLYAAIPASILLNKFNYNYFGIYTPIAIGWILFSYIIWKKGVNSYTSSNL